MKKPTILPLLYDGLASPLIEAKEFHFQPTTIKKTQILIDSLEYQIDNLFELLNNKETCRNSVLYEIENYNLIDHYELDQHHPQLEELALAIYQEFKEQLIFFNL